MSNSTNTRTPAPFSFGASQYFEGPDGHWSSFVVRVGTPEQTFRVLPSTVTSETFVPLNGACKQGSPANCAFSRGVEMFQGKPIDGLQSKQSSTWSEIGIYQVAGREELSYNASGLYGLDSLGLMIANSGGPILPKQVVAGVVNTRFWVGRLGMDVKPSNFSEFENPQRSLIETLKEENYIPSLSYGYTAGAYYRKPSSYGSLVFGGYDQSRFEPNAITFPFDANDSRKPSVNIQSITTRGFTDTPTSLLPDGPAYSLIDFAEPQMWLPVSACNAFAKAFNLTYDNSTDLYLVDAVTRGRLLETNPSITFGLGTTANPSERVNIVLPYSAFDQQATYPIYQNVTNYFPIRRAYNDTQYTIGRTFFQEAYVRIDYGRGNFSVHQALFPTSNDRQNLVPISTPESSEATRKTDLHETRPLSKATIAGISVGGVIAMILLLLVVLGPVRQRRKRSKERRNKSVNVQCSAIEVADQPRLEPDGATFFEKDSHPFAEMESYTRHELQAAYGNGKPEDSDTRLVELALSSILEVHEMDDTQVCSAERDGDNVQPSWPPPGWI
ncbi:aspartic peptidase domain-containing protein [Phaeosphaeria sp. MPI-PUGE-AT-0046c]|nr:aspartic peptidase domain-containing protein [Phaeosphaeria sp. MPI-PUGE-AT-0046c]